MKKQEDLSVELIELEKELLAEISGGAPINKVKKIILGFAIPVVTYGVAIFAAELVKLGAGLKALVSGDIYKARIINEDAVSVKVLFAADHVSHALMYPIKTLNGAIFGSN